MSKYTPVVFVRNLNGYSFFYSSSLTRLFDAYLPVVGYLVLRFCCCGSTPQPGQFTEGLPGFTVPEDQVRVWDGGWQSWLQKQEAEGSHLKLPAGTRENQLEMSLSPGPRDLPSSVSDTSQDSSHSTSCSGGVSKCLTPGGGDVLTGPPFQKRGLRVCSFLDCDFAMASRLYVTVGRFKPVFSCLHSVASAL